MVMLWDVCVAVATGTAIDVWVVLAFYTICFPVLWRVIDIGLWCFLNLLLVAAFESLKPAALFLHLKCSSVNTYSHCL